MPQRSFVLTLSCDDRPGIVAAVTTELFGIGANIAESNQFWDQETGRFFMRLAFTAPDSVGREDVERVLRPAFDRFAVATDFAALATALGCAGVTVADAAGLREALDSARASGDTTLIHCPVDDGAIPDSGAFWDLVLDTYGELAVGMG